MHSDLAAHLHTPECNELIRQLKECHETKKFGKFLGACSDIDRLVNRCLKQEREDNRAKNLEKGKLMRQKIHAGFKADKEKH